MPRHEPARSETFLRPTIKERPPNLDTAVGAAGGRKTWKICEPKVNNEGGAGRRMNSDAPKGPRDAKRAGRTPSNLKVQGGEAEDSDEAPATSALVPRPSPARPPRGVRGAWGAHAAHPGDRAGVKSPPPRLRLPDLGRPGVASGAPRAAATARASSSSPTRVAARLAEGRSRGFLGLARALSGTTETFQAARSRALPVTRLRRPARRPRSRHGARSAPPPQPRSRRRCPRAHLSSRLVTSLLRLGSAHSDLLNVSASSTLSAMEQVSWNICRMHGWTKDLSSHCRSPSMLESKVMFQRQNSAAREVLKSLLEFAGGPLQTLFALLSPAEATKEQRLLPAPSESFTPEEHPPDASWSSPKATDHLLFLTLWTLWRKNNSAFMIVPGNKKPRIRQIG
ncbi:uncharacterized protein LOC108310819 [Cebus imitator]|uniref:uncharacterized protein LOC108310819 n=1 Tax=Cebus imitator TaxID=2715852 RepID=UPI001898A5E9|nr:uncharacterized protein LOC108310819 [Cebus imitator]